MEILGRDGRRYRRRMCSFDVSRVESPACSLERSSVEEIVVYGDQTLTDAVSDLGQVASSQLVRDQATSRLRLV